MTRSLLPLALLLTLLSCVPRREMERLYAQNAALEAALSASKADLDATLAELAVCEQTMATTRPAELAPYDEELARALYQQAADAAPTNAKLALELLDELYEKYPESRAARGAALRLSRELSVVGKTLVTPPVLKWFHGSDAQFHLERGLTVVVFWEVWCPHCKHSLPELQRIYEDMQGELEIVALTKITKSATEEKVQAFIAESGLTYPIAKEDGALSTACEVTGIPAAVVVKDGVVVYRGHPNALTVDMLRGWR